MKPDDYSISPSKSRVIIIWLFTCVFTLALVFSALHSWMTSRLSDHSQLINVAGKQRALIQQSLRYLHYPSYKQRNEKIPKITQELLVNQHFLLESKNSPLFGAIQNVYLSDKHSLTDRLYEFVENVHIAIALKGQGIHSVSIEEVGDTLFDDFDTAVKALDAQASQKMNNLVFIQVLSALLLFTTLILIIFLIFNPLEKKLFIAVKKIISSKQDALQMLDDSPDATVSINGDNLIIYFSQKAQALWEYHKDEVLGKNVSVLVPIEIQGQHDSFITAHRKTGINKIIGQDREMKITTKSGKVRDCVVHLCKNKKVGDKSGYTAFIRDISKEKQVSLELEESRKTFMMQSKLAFIGELAAGIGHEINNPLSIILANAEMLLAQSSPLDPSNNSSRKSLESIFNASERAAKIVKGLKSISRLNSEVVMAEIEEINYICKSTVEMMQGLYKNKGIDISYQSPNCDCYVQIDIVRFQQVLINLIENAKDAVLDNDEKKILIMLEQKATHYLLKVSDNGAGISDDIKDKIFEPFYTTKSLGKGTGLGLSVINTIIQSVGGVISIESGKESGTTFIIELPAQTNKLAKVEEFKSQYITSKMKILIVDDESDICTIVNQYLIGQGHQVVACTSASEAMKLSKETVFDLLISDFMMPDQNGIELIKNVRNLTGYNKTKYMLMTGNVMNGLDELVTENIADMVINKPFSMKYLSSQISLLMNEN